MKWLPATRRLRLVNDYPNARLFLDATRLQLSGPSRALQYPDLHVLAKLNNQSVRVYAAKHSMISFTSFPKATVSGIRGATITDFQRRGRSPNLCEDCVREDRSARGFGHCVDVTNSSDVSIALPVHLLA